MKRYKLVRIVNGRYFSANTVGYGELEYKVGEVTATPLALGIASYKALKYADRPGHIRETRDSFNEGKPIAILGVEPLGRHIRSPLLNYHKGWYYEGGINYPAVRVTEIVKTIKGME